MSARDIKELRAQLMGGFSNEIAKATRFGLVGLISTLAHMLTVWMLVRGSELSTLTANTVAFLCAFGISFSGNYFWTFQSPGKPKTVLFRFMIISSLGFLLNTLLLALILRGGYVEPAIAAVIAAIVVPIFSYTAARFWGFKVASEGSGSPRGT